ncbi:hypothetical protein PF003_g22510 [Phytophthora fragariae]|nr:hypothetical protein PF003_g22510 [Phytophthora fragariae]
MGAGQLLNNSRKILAILLRIDARLPGSIPTLLVENVNKMVEDGKTKDHVTEVLGK